MAVTDLTNTKWLFNQFVNFNFTDDFYIDFTDDFYSTSTLFHLLKVYYDPGETPSDRFELLIYSNDDDIDEQVYVDSQWVQEGNRTIEITGGTDVTNSTLIAWIENNAVQVLTNINIVLGNNTLNGVDTIKVQDSVDTTQYKDFIYGATPSSTTSIKIGNNTLNGVNQISVMGTDDTYKSFGYVAPVSGYSVTLDGTGQYQDIGDDFYGHMKINTPPSSFYDQDAKWGAYSGNTFIYDGTGQNPTLTKTFTNVKKLYCWGDDDGTENALVKINNVNISTYDWNNPYVIDITEDCTLTVMASTEG